LEHASYFFSISVMTCFASVAILRSMPQAGQVPAEICHSHGGFAKLTIALISVVM
jgi:hypothetical protein